ncbi:NAD(P)-dependent malic enzyme [Candidatus Synchoanobacter obligatus]|uniref:Malate dehydrogenase n=1 Tax=Candidatus Synchoanobacter obligatus TaxID=2919597 RepID=A0ABT1L6P8_9GAMM|nr:malic enzyme-like NAD(P)-binding protein [Candidatus Synchoanobacter obligatus]MCP8352581.1 malate dehydrogenase [Candidatus Synchoanobacter obligatus]
MSFEQACKDYHSKPKPGKISIKTTKPTETLEDLSKAYSPGVGVPVKEIHANPEDAYQYTNKGNLIGVISNGTAVLGFGNVGPLAAKPVMEGKAVLFSKMAGLDAYDIVINEEDPDKLINIIEAIAPTFGAINLEDIKSPDCFYIETELRRRLNIPVFHDDQHGTAIVVAAGLLNALSVQNLEIHQSKIVLLGAGAAGIAVAHIVLNLGASPELFHLVDRNGVVHEERDLPDFKRPFAKKANMSLKDAMTDADVFIGLAAPNALPEHYLDLMKEKSIVFALSNPVPEVSPESVSKRLPSAIYSTGRSDLPNQINNALAFPHILRAALTLKIPQITPQMIANCATAVANLIKKPSKTEIVPTAFDKRLPEAFLNALSESS